MGNQWVDFTTCIFKWNKSLASLSQVQAGCGTKPSPQTNIEPHLATLCLIWVVQFAVVQWILIAKYFNSKMVVKWDLSSVMNLYMGFVGGYVRNGAEFLAVITNDAWWGTTPGHRQLLSYTKLRAIETRLPIVRSANSGISAIINSYGEVTKQIPYLKRGAISVTIVPQNQITFYVTYGDYIARLSLFVSVLLLLISITRKN